MLPRHLNLPLTMMARRVHRASHSSMLCEVRTMLRPSCEERRGRKPYSTAIHIPELQLSSYTNYRRQHVPEMAPCVDVHPCRRLIQKDNRWVANEGDAGAQLALVTATEERGKGETYYYRTLCMHIHFVYLPEN